MPSHKNSKPVYWPQSFLRRGAEAHRECQSPDAFILVRYILERTIRSQHDLIELLSPDTAATSALPRRTDVVSAAGHVR